MLNMVIKERLKKYMVRWRVSPCKKTLQSIVTRAGRARWKGKRRNEVRPFRQNKLNWRNREQQMPNLVLKRLIKKIYGMMKSVTCANSASVSRHPSCDWTLKREKKEGDLPFRQKHRLWRKREQQIPNLFMKRLLNKINGMMESVTWQTTLQSIVTRASRELYKGK